MKNYYEFCAKVNAITVAELEVAMVAHSIDMSGEYIERHNISVVRWDAGKWSAVSCAEPSHYVDIYHDDWWPGATVREAAMRAIYAELMR